MRGVLGKVCFQDLSHFICSLAGEQVNVGNPGVEKRKEEEGEESVSVNLQIKPFSIIMHFHL